MKKILILLIPVLLCFSCKNSEKKDKDFLIKAYITGYFDGNVGLYKVRKGKLIIVDSLHMKKSKFKFKHVKIKTPEMFWIIIDKGNFVIQFFADPHNMQINADYNNKSKLEVQGSKTNDAYVSFLENNSVFENKQLKINEQKDLAFANKDTVLLKSLDSALNNVTENQINFIKKYAYENNKSFVSLYITLSNLSDYLKLTELEKIVDNFSDTLKQSPYYIELKDLIQAKKNVLPKMQAPDFSLPDTSETAVSLSSLQGKFILLDFSASWNGNCRVQNKTLKKIYKKYHSSEFEIYQVSIENNMQQWKNVIRADKINWITVSDIKGLDSEVLQLYTVRKLPQYFLLNKNGIIIETGNNLKEIEKKLGGILSGS
ncbi:MAG: AhpC/TSA family protein [Bacteroidales bacterium]|nr:AhpC/TSA family protein [Bacteroidales bacterium]